MPKQKSGEKWTLFNKLRTLNLAGKEDYEALTIKQMKKLLEEHEAKEKAAKELAQRDAEAHEKATRHMEENIVKCSKCGAQMHAEPKSEVEEHMNNHLKAEQKAKAQACPECGGQIIKDLDGTFICSICHIETPYKMTKIEKEKAKAKEKAMKEAIADDKKRQAQLEDARALILAEGKRIEAEAEAAKNQAPVPAPPAPDPPPKPIVHDCHNCGFKICKANMDAMACSVAANSCGRWIDPNVPKVPVVTAPPPKFQNRDQVIYKGMITAQVEGFWYTVNGYRYRLQSITENKKYEDIPEIELELVKDKTIPAPPAPAPVPIDPKDLPAFRDCKNCGFDTCRSIMQSMLTLVPVNSCGKWIPVPKKPVPAPAPAPPVNQPLPPSQ